MSKQSLSGKTAIVTGAARGVGRQLAEQLVAKGVKVAMADLNQDDLDKAAAEIASEIGPGATPMALDVSDLAAYTAYIKTVERKLGPIDILANVAGIMPIGDFQDEPEATTQRIVDVNLNAVIHSTKEVAKLMRKRGSGHIVNVASGAGWIAGGGGATYCGTKFGVVGYSESVALELKGSGVHISVVAPAVIKTELSTGLKEVRGVRAVEPSEVAEAMVKLMEQKKPKFVVFVPKAIGVMAMSFSAIPHRTRHAIARMAKTDKLLLDADFAARKDYDKRSLTKPAAKPKARPAAKPKPRAKAKAK